MRIYAVGYDTILEQQYKWTLSSAIKAYRGLWTQIVIVIQMTTHIYPFEGENQKLGRRGISLQVSNAIRELSKLTMDVKHTIAECLS